MEKKKKQKKTVSTRHYRRGDEGELKEEPKTFTSPEITDTGTVKTETFIGNDAILLHLIIDKLIKKMKTEIKNKTI